jgi:hypothetical protein
MVKQPTSRWSAVSIVAGTGGCEAAFALKGRRFLGAEAPQIPLAECTCAPTCRCVYRKYSDRRAGPRREEEHSGMRRAGTSDPERRIGRGRRKTDV